MLCSLILFLVFLSLTAAPLISHPPPSTQPMGTRYCTLNPHTELEMSYIKGVGLYFLVSL